MPRRENSRKCADKVFTKRGSKGDFKRQPMLHD